MSYSVLFRKFPLDDFDSVAAAVCEVYGIADFDARQKIRRGWGFLERDASAELAQRIQAAMGDRVLVFDDSQLRTLADPLVLNGCDLTEAGFGLQFQDPREEPRVLAWTDVRIVAAGGFTEELIRHQVTKDGPSSKKMMIGLGVFMLTGIPMGLFGDKKDKKNAKPVKTNRYVSFGRIVTPRGEQFSFNPNHFDFTGLGTRKQLNVAANFRTLLAALQESSGAQLNHGARLLAQNQALTLANYQSFDDFETELQWMFNVSLVAD